MSLATFSRRSRIAVPADEVFAWHARPGALERLSPPWQPVRVVDRRGGIEDGGRVELRIGPLGVRWIAEHRDYIAGRQFRDVQSSGPFAHWVHTHRIEPDGPDACTLEDSIEYALPGGVIGRLLGSGAFHRKLARIFDYRHAVTAADNLDHHRYADRPRLRVLVSGATGLVGTAVSAFLTTGGHTVVPLVRRPRTDTPAVLWDPARGTVDAGSLEGFDAVVHLAGESIASGRWTAAKKARILHSRVDSTRLLAREIAKLARPPRVLLVASAIGFYGDAGSTELDEHSASGSGFLADVCRQWENAAEPATERDVRVVHLRFGVILSPAGGALRQMLMPFRLGVGGRLGSGSQYMSWIALDDVVGAIHHALMRDEVAGPVNVVAPAAVTNLEFTKTLGRVLRRPTVFPVPAVAARAAFGEMANELLLASQHVRPKTLIDTGYSFRLPELEAALCHVLGANVAG